MPQRNSEGAVRAPVFSLASLRQKLLLSLSLGLAVVLGLMLYADLPKLLTALARFQWQYVPAILGLTLVNYCLRFLKWEYYLRQIGVHGLSRGDSFLTFFSGLSMVITPGKIGEWLKCYLLRELSGTAFSTSAPIIIAERLTDGVAMALIATAGLLVFKVGWQVVASVLLLAAVIVALSQYEPLARKAFSLVERLPLMSARMHHLRAFYQSSRTLFSLKNLFIAVAIGTVAWSSECVAFYYVLVGLGQEETLFLLLTAAFMLAAATLAGSLLLLPGGLGVAEGGITGMSQWLLAMPKDQAAAAALIIRLCTLWFGLTLGVLTLSVITRKLQRSGV